MTLNLPEGSNFENKNKNADYRLALSEEEIGRREGVGGWLTGCRHNQRSFRLFEVIETTLIVPRAAARLACSTSLSTSDSPHRYFSADHKSAKSFNKQSLVAKLYWILDDISERHGIKGRFCPAVPLRLLHLIANRDKKRN